MFQNSPNQQALSNSMLFDFQYVELFPLTLSSLLGNLVTAVICGLIISVVYKQTHKAGYSPSFITSLIILPIITAVVILLIGNNVARAFGLVGAMSVIRFRTSLRDPQDIIFIFFALAVGMAAGVNLGVTAIITTLLIGVVVYLVITFHPNPTGSSYLLQIRYEDSTENEVNLGTLLTTYCAQIKLMSYNKATEATGAVVSESLYQVHFKNGKSSPELIQQMNLLLTNCVVTVKVLDAEGKVVKPAGIGASKKKNKKQEVAK